MSSKKNNFKMEPKNIIITALIIVILIMGFYMGKLSGQNNSDNINSNTNNTTNVDSSTEARTDIIMTVIDDNRCEECYTQEILTQLKAVPELANATIIEKDFSDEGVSEYLTDNNINALPAVIFNSSDIEATINNYLVELTSGEYSLLLGSTFDPFAEICDNNIDDTSNGLVDCEDTTCSSKPVCRSEEQGKLDVFLMGFCPFGEIAANSIPSLVETFGDNINIDVHYIASKVSEGTTADAFDSLHGVTEAEEDIRQLCIKKYYGVDTLISYFGERYKNADNYGAVSDEASIAYDAVNINAETIDSCIVNGEGASLLEEDIKLAQALGISASPTWLANNRYTFGGIEAAAIQSEFCKYNPELEGCNSQIEASTNTTGTTPSCN